MADPPPSRIDDIVELEREVEELRAAVSTLTGQLRLMDNDWRNKLGALTDRVVALESAVWEGIPKGAND
jgi:hypothetical protein